MNEGRSEPVVSLRIGYPGASTDILKTTVRFLPVERVTLARETSGAAHHRHSSKLTKVLSYSAWLTGIGGIGGQVVQINRSEERRVGKECRTRWSPDS